MDRKMRAAAHSHAMAPVLAIAAALGYNNWLLSPYLNARLLKANGSISEYSAPSQPHHLVFQSLDIVSGLLLIGLGLLLWKRLRTSHTGKVMAAGVIILGAANATDALLRLPCSETLDRACHVPVSVSLNHFQVPAHAYTSTAIAICYFILPLSALVFAYRRRLKLMAGISAVAVAGAIVSFATAVAQYLRDNSLSVQTSGVGQQLQMLIIGAWLIVVCLSILGKKGRALKTQGALPVKKSMDAGD